MRKFLIFFISFWTIFIVLIFMSSYSWASVTSTELTTIDLDTYPIYTIDDIVNILDVYKSSYSDYWTFEELFSDYYLLGVNTFASDGTLSNSSTFFIMPGLEQDIYIGPRLNSTYGGSMIFTQDLANSPQVISPYYCLQYGYDVNSHVGKLYLNTCTDSWYNSVAIHKSYATYNNVAYLWSNANNVYYVSNPSNVSNKTVLTNNGSIIIPEEEEEESIIDSLKHLFIPTSEDISDMQSNFSTKIGNKFTMSAWTFNQSDIDLDDYSYYDYSAPKWDFHVFNNTWTFDTQFIFDLLDTPIDLGYRTYRFGDYDENANVKVNQTNGLTPRSLINIFLILNIFLLNIGLYNRFFAKGE